MSFRVFIAYTTSCLVARKVEETENLKFMLVSWVVKQWNIRNARISVFVFFWLQFLGNQLVLISIRKFVQILSGSSENCTQVMESEIWSLTLLLRLGFWMFCTELRALFITCFFRIPVAATENGVFTSPEMAKSFDFTSEERIYNWYFILW